MAKPAMTPDERAAYAAILATLDADAAVTLSYNDLHIRPDRMCRDLRTVRAHVDRAVLGRRFHRFPLACRSHFWAIPEKVVYHPHWHLGWRLAAPKGFYVAPSMRVEMLITLLDDVWPKVASRGSVDVQHYKSGWAEYATKALQLETDIIMSNQFD